jgi:hypothetical protein
MQAMDAIRPLVLSVLLLSVAGCWNSPQATTNYHFGDVSLGQQLIDLRRALDDDALTNAEYEQAKAALLALYERCGARSSES